MSTDDMALMLTRLEQQTIVTDSTVIKIPSLIKDSKSEISETEIDLRQTRFLNFTDSLKDGSIIRLSDSEAYVFDSRTDSVLDSCIKKIQALLRIYVGIQRRATVLCKYCLLQFGGKITEEIKTETNQIIQSKLISETKSISMGHLLHNSRGTSLHRALFYKYIADKTVSDPKSFQPSHDLNSEPIVCAIQLYDMNEATIFLNVNGKKHYFDYSDTQDLNVSLVCVDTIKISDILANNIHLEKILFSPTNVMNFSDKTKYAQLRGKKAKIYKSTEGLCYDLNRLLFEIEVLKSASHANVSDLIGVHFDNYGQNIINDEILKSSRIWLAYDEPEWMTLRQLVSKKELSLMDRFKISYQLAGGISHFHGLDLHLGNLSSESVLVADLSKDFSTMEPILKLKGFGPERYVLSEAKKIIPPECRDDMKKDIYAFGILLGFIITGKETWNSKEDFSAVDTKLISKDKSCHFFRLVEECVLSNPSARPSIYECFDRLKIIVSETPTKLGQEDMKENDSQLFSLSHNSSVISNSLTSSMYAAFDNERFKIYRTIGNMDAKMIITSEHGCTFRMISRSNGNVMLISNGLTNPPNVDPNFAGHGLEICGETTKQEVGQNIESSFLYQMLNEVALYIKKLGLRVRNSLDSEGFVSMELNSLNVPPVYFDPNTGRTCVLLGILVDDIQQRFSLNQTFSVRICTVRLLTFSECLVIRKYGKYGRKALADTFIKEKLSFISTFQSFTPSYPGLLKVEQKQPSQQQQKVIPSGLVNSNILAAGPVALLPDPEIILWDTERLQSKVMELKLQMKVQVRTAEHFLHSNRGTQYITYPILPLLPLYEEKKFQTNNELSSKFILNDFNKFSLLSTAMCMLDMRIRVLSNSSIPTQVGSDSKKVLINPLILIAKHLDFTLQTQTQVAGWVHFEEYLSDCDRYLNRLKKSRNLGFGTPSITYSNDVSNVDLLLSVARLKSIAESLINRLFARVQFVAELQNTAGQTFDPDFCLLVVASDGEFMSETGKFMNDAHQKVNDMLNKNPGRFSAFKEMIKQGGVPWPHSPVVKISIENAGFEFSPTMIRQDRCICKTCQVEIDGWRQWFNPWHMHNLSRHSEEFAKLVARFGLAFPQSGLFDFSLFSKDSESIIALQASSAAALAIESRPKMVHQ